MNPYPEEESTFRSPQDLEIEKVLLTSICVAPDNPEVPEVLRILNGGEAYVGRAHKAIHLAFKALYERGDEINSILLKNECEAQGTLERAGGMTNIFEIVGATEEVSHPLKLAKRIQDLHLRRQIQRTASAVLNQAGDPGITTQALLASLQQFTAPQDEPVLVVAEPGEFLDFDPQPNRWLVQGLLPLGVPTVMASKGGLGKSFLALQLCIALATGKGFLSCPAQEPMGAIYFGLEDDKNTFHRRVRSIVDHYKACEDWTEEDDQNLRQNFRAPFMNWRVRGASSHLPAVVPHLAKVLQWFEDQCIRPGLIVVDTLARVSEGDENTVQALRPIMNACSALAEYGWTSMLLHHVGKGQDGAKAGANVKKPFLSDRMSTEWVRGSSSIVDNFRAVLQITLINEDEAARAGLDEEMARIGCYAVFGATKLNGGQKADWLFIEQDDHGRWFAPQDGVETLAKIRGSKALAALSRQVTLLVDIYTATRWGGEPNREELTKKHVPDDSKNPTIWFRQAIFRLRKNGFLQKNSYQLTAQGLQEVSRVTQHGGEHGKVV